MSFSTAKILDVLLQLPPSGGKLKPIDFKDYHQDAKQSDQQTDVIVADDSNTEDVLQLKIKAPRLAPQNKQTLTLEENQRLKQELKIAKRALENFKDVLRLKGFDVTNYFVSIHNGRISYHIPNQEHFSFFMKNKHKFIQDADVPEKEPVRFSRRSR